MGKVTYKDLHTLVTESIYGVLDYNTLSPYSSQLSRVSVAPLSTSSTAEISAAELITSIQDILRANQSRKLFCR